MTHPLFTKWLCGNAEAVDFILRIHRIVELWDDLLDKDKPVSDAEINGAFISALVALPRNQFYMRNFAVLSPILESAIDSWHVSNALEKLGGKDPLTTAFILRCSFFALTIAAAKIIGGPKWAQTVGTEIYQAGDDNFDSYCAEHGGT